MAFENQPNTLQDQPFIQSPQPISSPTHGIKKITFIVLGILIIIGSTFLGIQIGKSQTSNQQSVPTQPTTSKTQGTSNPTSAQNQLPIAAQLTPTPTLGVVSPTIGPISPSFTPTSVSTTNTYQDPKGQYSFNYSSNYVLLSEVPSLFDGTMLDKVKNFCRGPVLQNRADPNVLIVMEIVPTDSDGGFCWSAGTFTQDNKWIGGGSSAWSGSYFLMKEVQESSQFRGFIGLANKETYTLKGQNDLDQIVSTFKFTN